MSLCKTCLSFDIQHFSRAERGLGVYKVQAAQHAALRGCGFCQLLLSVLERDEGQKLGGTPWILMTFRPENEPPRTTRHRRFRLLYFRLVNNPSSRKALWDKSEDDKDDGAVHSLTVAADSGKQ